MLMTVATAMGRPSAVVRITGAMKVNLRRVWPDSSFQEK